MKKFLIPLLLVSNVATAECLVTSASNRVSEQNVGPITNLAKDKAMGRCTVSFDITVNGISYHLTETEKGLEQEESLCYYARERARKNLLLDLGGKISAESTMVCKEGVIPKKAIYKIGESVMESQMPKSKVDKYFTYNGQRCRLFQQSLEKNRETRTYYGVICQSKNDSDKWTIVDKW